MAKNVVIHEQQHGNTELLKNIILKLCQRREEKRKYASLGKIYNVLKNNNVLNNKRKLTGSKEILGGLLHEQFSVTDYVTSSGRMTDE
jgi:hypothetical protein